MRVETACGRVRWVKAGQQFTAVFHLSVSEKNQRRQVCKYNKILEKYTASEMTAVSCDTNKK